MHERHGMRTPCHTTVTQTVVARLWWGPFRRPFEALARRTVSQRPAILFGPLRGETFAGGLAHLLGIYEIHVQKAFLSHLVSGGVLYDIGANLGYFSLLGAKTVGSTGHVYAFEPFADNAGRIRRVAEANHLENLTVVEQAVSSENGRSELYFDSDADIATPSLLRGPAGGKVQVHTVTLDSFVATHPAPQMIKMDVEGAEVLILDGAAQMLDNGIVPSWIVEVHSQENDRMIRERFRGSGYGITDLPSPRKRREGYPRNILARFLS